MALVQLMIASTILLFFRLLFHSFTPVLRDIPGPFLAKFTNLWRLIETWKGHHERTMQDLHHRYGPVVRTGPNIVSLTDPDAIEGIYGVKADLPKVRLAVLPGYSFPSDAVHGIERILQGYADISQWQNCTYPVNCHG